MDHTLPLFPLDGALLAPQAVLPLQLFEPRYVRMMRDMLAAGKRHLVLGCIRPGYGADEFGRPTVYPIAGAGSVSQVQEVPGNRFTLLLRGETRVRILDEEPQGELPYRRVRVLPLAEAEPEPGSAIDLRAELVRALETDVGGLQRPEEHSLGWLTDQLLMSLSLAVPRRQEIFALVDPRTRAQEVLDVHRAAERMRRELGGFEGTDPSVN